MPKFKYLGDDARVFPDVSLEVKPGGTYELAANPDPSRFEELGTDNKKVTKE